MANPIRSIVDPRTSPYFGRGVGPDGDYYGVGTGGGMGYLQSLLDLPGSEQYLIGSGNMNESGGRIDPDALAAYLQANGLSINDEATGSGGTRYLTDASGAMVGAPQSYDYNDNDFWTAGMLAAGLVGGAVAMNPAYGGLGTTAAEGGAAAAGAGEAGGLTALGEAGGYGFASGEAAGAAPTLLAGGGASGAAGSAAGAAGGGSMGWADWAQLGVGLLGDAYQSNQIENASAAQQAATAGAIGEQRRQFDLTRGDLAPYREAGYKALPQYEQLTNTPTTAADAMADPGYAWAQQQGQQALDRKAAASGGRISGASLKAASRFNQGNATQYFGQADQRRENRLSRLAALSGIGQAAVNTGAQSGQNMANQVGGYMQQQGDATGAAALARGNVWGDRANQIAALYGRKTYGNGD